MRKVAQKAFTMIELLVVIAVIGVMATAVLSAINPLEQINKGSDTGLRSDAEQLLSGVDRYYSSLTYFPWMNGTNDSNHVNITWQNIISANVLTGYNPLLTKLLDTQEVKSGFADRLVDTYRNPLYIMYNNAVSSATMYACFMPKSHSFLTEAADRCKNETNSVGTPYYSTTRACPGGVGASSTCGTGAVQCYVCLP